MQSQFIEIMAKHLPPSASTLRLLDIGGAVGATLNTLRADLDISTASLYIPDWAYASASFDAVVAYDVLLKPELLSAVLNVMRAGGRFIVVHPVGTVDEHIVTTLETAGYVRILVESAVAEQGVLIRGEKAHHTADTLARIDSVAQHDTDQQALVEYQGRYLYLLVVQTPNKPVWKLAPDEQLAWSAATANAQLLAFSSLPKAVSFMQAAVLSGFMSGINKMGKFSKETAFTWTMPTLLNPILEDVQQYAVDFISIDPETAEVPDE